MNEIKINESFQSLIPKLTAEEYAQLEKNCIEEGIREKLVAGNGVLVEGGSRYHIALRNNLRYETRTMSFADETDAKIWMLNLQLGRRNLTVFAKVELQYEKKKLLLSKGKDAQVRKRAELVLSTIDKTKPHNTQKQIAQDLNISTGKLAMTEVVIKKASEAVKLKCRSGEISINEAYNEIKKIEKVKLLEIKKKEYKATIAKDKDVSNRRIDIHTTKKKFRIIYCDAPFRYTDKRDNPKLGGSVKHYNTMSIQELCELPIAKIADQNSVLFFWVPSPLLTESFEVLSAWKFRYVSSFVWNKNRHNLGFYNSVQHEFLLIAVRGSATPDNKKLYDSVVTITRSKTHSEKPEEFRKIIDSLYTHGSRLEIFARKPRNDDWYFWGNEV